MAIGIFTNRAHQPTTGELLATINSKCPLWQRLTRFITDNYRIKEDLAFYGKNYGWAVRFRKGSKALISLYPDEDSFTAQIIIGSIQAEKTFSLNLSNNVKRTLENAHEFPEGRWLFIKIETEQDVSNIQQLLTIKLTPGAQKK
jgi:hypothetical protein